MPFEKLIARARRHLIRPELVPLQQRLNTQRTQQQRLRVALGQLMAHTVAGSAKTCNDAEFSAFSQYGEDGIIEYLIRNCDIAPTTFVEIGVETYEESNTRFLAEHRLWSGLIVDQNPRLARDLARTTLDWRAQVHAVSAFVTREGARGLVEPLVGEELGLLSVDIDGVDYWIVEQLLVLRPAMVVVEYNSLFGARAPVSIPYDPGFDRRRPEYHGIYYGAGLAAFAHLLERRGYALVACTTAGNNAFFVRSDCLREVPERSVEDAYRPRRFAEHSVDGALTGLADPARQLADVRRLPLVDVTDGKSLTVADLL